MSTCMYIYTKNIYTYKITALSFTINKYFMTNFRYGFTKKCLLQKGPSSIQTKKYCLSQTMNSST